MHRENRGGWLICCNEWIGPSRTAIERRTMRSLPVVQLVSFYSYKLTKSRCLERITEYQAAYNVRYQNTTALSLTLVSVSHVGRISPEVLARFANMSIVEDLSDFKDKPSRLESC